MSIGKAFCPCHITGLFVIHENPDPLKTGSRGAGVSLEKGVYTTVRAVKSPKWRAHIRINRRPTEAFTSSAVVEEFSTLVPQPHDVFVEHQVEVPVGAGYGASGAGALSLSLGLNEALGAGLSKVEAARVAHVAEVKCGTGLGTVLAETFGGFEIREKPGAPGVGSVRRIPTSDEKVVSLFVGPLPTKRFLENPDVKRRVNAAGKRFLSMFIKKPTLKNFLVQSRKFADGLNLYTPKMRNILKEFDARGFDCFTMNMFGEAVFTVVEEERLQSLVHLLEMHEGFGSQIIVSGIDQEGARLIG